jgi:hypothetical protein
LARNSQSPGMPSTTLIALALGALGLFAFNKRPLQDTRPAEPPAPIYWHGPVEIQDIEARLWEDPLAAVARVRAADPAHDVSERHTPLYLQSVLAAQKSLTNVLALGVFVSGAPYAEDIETRRRARYAVLAGLHRAGFVPQNAEHVGYFLLPGSSGESATVVVYESLIAEYTDKDSAHDLVLLLWLDQDAFRERPLAQFSSVVKMSTPEKAKVFASIVGPADSDGLRDMARELKSCAGMPDCPSGVDETHPIAVYSSTATAAGDWVLGKAPVRCVNSTQPEGTADVLAAAFRESSHDTVRLYRTIANDCEVTNKLYDELVRRGLMYSGEITIVAERDSLYSRLMGKYFGGCYTAAAAGVSAASSQSPSDHPRCYTYLRGLDGLAPPTASHTTAGGSSPVNVSDSSKTNNPLPSTPETPTGPRQLDYLRRLAATVTAGTRKKSCGPDVKKTGDCNRAIGVLGSDIYDKILVLQALRSAFPRAIFFTTDLDSLLLDRQHLKWTRHLLVGSGFGLALRPELQADIPPFRTSYQTATYLATMLAVNQHFTQTTAKPSDQADSTNTSSVTNDQVLELVSAWTSNARIFDIGRTDAFDITKPRLSPDVSSLCPALLQCPAIFPAPAGAFWSDRARPTGTKIGVVIICIFLLAAWTAYGLNPGPKPGLSEAAVTEQQRALLRLRIRAGMAALLFLIAITFAWHQLVDWAESQETAVPVFGGASIWAALIVELLSVLAVVCLTKRGQRMLDQNSVDIGREFKLENSPDKLIAFRAAQVARLPWRSQLKELIWFPIQSVSALVAESPDDNSFSPVEHLFARYLFRGRWLARFTRVLVATCIAVLGLMLIDHEVGTSYIEVGVLLPSGNFARGGAKILSLLSLMSIQFLVFWVADAMMLSRAFTLELLRDRPEWPSHALSQEETELGLSSGPSMTWLNLKLVGSRTICVANLVWYPSIVIALMAIAAFTVEFGPFSFASNPVSLIISTLLLVAAALLLRASAEQLRSKALTWLEDYRSRALRPQCAITAEAPQLEHLIARVRDLAKGAFAPYSQQPLVKALLVPAATYGSNLLLQYLSSLGL